jgi:hypothetical protein
VSGYLLAGKYPRQDKVVKRMPAGRLGSQEACKPEDLRALRFRKFKCFPEFQLACLPASQLACLPAS